MPIPNSVDPRQSLKIYFSTVVRSAPQESGGEIVLLNWNNKTIEARQPINPTNPQVYDPNPRGNSRGGRGIEFIDDKVLVANYHTIEVYSRSLNHQRNITNSLLAGLHEIHKSPDRKIWISSTAIDAAIGIDFDNSSVIQQYWPREISVFQHELKLAPLEIDKKSDNRTLFLDENNSRQKGHLHLNAVASWHGEIYALFNKYNLIANLDRGEIVIKDNSLFQPHNLLIEDDGTAIVNNTFNRRIHIYNLHTKKMKRTINLANFGLVRKLIFKHDPIYFIKTLLGVLFSRKISAPRPIFVRGLDKYGDLLFVGISPATILCINWKSGKLIDSYCFSDDVGVCIHGLKVLAE